MAERGFHTAEPCESHVQPTWPCESHVQRIADAVGAGVPGLGHVRMLAIDGPSGSGKSTLAVRLVTRLTAGGVPTALVPTDHFATWDDPVAWWPRLADGVLLPLAAGRDGSYRRMRWYDGLPYLGETVLVPPRYVLVVEGVSAARRSTRTITTVTVWVERPDAHDRLEAAVARDGENCREQLRRWQAFERGWFPIDGTRARADILIEY